MNNELKRASQLLAKGALHRIEDGRGVRVQCLEGSLWLTQEGDRRDIVLEAGDEALIERDGRSMLSALSDTRFVLLQPGGAAAATKEDSGRAIAAVE